jgi:hypothetical protein
MSDTPPTPSKKRKKSSVRHTRAIQYDRAKRAVVDNLPAQVETVFKEIIHPLTLAQCELFRQMGMRERTLTLPVMMALLLSTAWRQIAGVNELVRLVRTEALVWEKPQKVSQQALSLRLSSMPAELFLNVLNQLLPIMQQRWQARLRPLAAEIQWAYEHFANVLIVDGSTLDALIKKIGLLQAFAKNPLAGKMTALLELGSRLPRKIWFKNDPQTNDQTFWEQILAELQPDSLLLFDKGYTNFERFRELTSAGVTFITRAKSNLKYEVVRALAAMPKFRDTIIYIGDTDTHQRLRLVEVLYGKTWHCYLTNEIDPEKLPARQLVALYYRRWTVEQAFNTVKRLLGLAYFWSGSQNSVELQLWSTWIVYAILIDLCDQVAGLRNVLFDRISIEMVYRSLYYYLKAYARGDADELPGWLATCDKVYGVVKRKPKKKDVFQSWPLTIAASA